MSRTIADVIAQLEAEIADRQASIEMLRRFDEDTTTTALASAVDRASVSPPVEFRPKGTKPIAAAMDPGARKPRVALDMDEVRRLHATGLTSSQIAAQLGVSMSGLSVRMKVAGLVPNGAKRSSVERVMWSTVIAFLKGRDVPILNRGPGTWDVNGQSYGRDEVLALANAKRGVMNLPPFEVET